jgi:hypothetical protein
MILNKDIIKGLIPCQLPVERFLINSKLSVKLSGGAKKKA